MYEEELRRLSVKLLDEVEYIIGYTSGTLPFRSRPFLCRKKEEVELLTFDHFSGSNLTRYLLGKDLQKHEPLRYYSERDRSSEKTSLWWDFPATVW